MPRSAIYTLRTFSFCAALALTTAHAASIRVYPGWSAIPASSEADAIERGFKCIGGECAGDTLQCVYFRRNVTMPEGTRTEALVGDKFTWGQFEYWLARRYLDERTDVQIGLETISSSRRSEPPTLQRSATASYVAVAYTTAIRDWEIRLPVALWVKGGEVRGLRCSYRAIDGDDPRDKIAQLLDLVIAE